MSKHPSTVCGDPHALIGPHPAANKDPLPFLGTAVVIGLVPLGGPSKLEGLIWTISAGETINQQNFLFVDWS